MALNYLEAVNLFGKPNTENMLLILEGYSPANKLEINIYPTGSILVITPQESQKSCQGFITGTKLLNLGTEHSSC